MKKTLLVLVVLMFTAGSAMAGNMDTFGIGARAQSLGGAYAATADDPYAVYYNPAGLTQIESLTMSAGVVLMDPSLKAKGYTVTFDNTTAPAINDLGPTDIEDQSDTLIVPSMGGAMPISDDFTVGMASYAPYGSHLKWVKDSAENPGAFNAYESAIGRMVMTPAIAYKLNNMLSFGVGVSVGKASTFQKFQQFGLSVAMGGGDFGSGPYENPVMFHVDAEDDFNWSYNLGVMCNVTDNFTLGLTYRSRTSIEFEGELSFSGAGATLFGYDGKAFDVKINDLCFPEQVQLGARYNPKQSLSLEVDLVWTNWGAIETQTLTYEPIPIFAPTGETVLQRNWRNTLQVRCGAEWLVTDMVALRVGYYYDPSPIPDESFDIPWPDGDKNTFTLGFGLTLAEHWTIDTVLQYTYTMRDRIIDGESHTLNESYAYMDTSNHAEVEVDASGHLWGYGLTVTYTF